MGLSEDCEKFITPDGRVLELSDETQFSCIWRELSLLAEQIRQTNDRLEKLIFALATKGG